MEEDNKDNKMTLMRMGSNWSQNQEDNKNQDLRMIIDLIEEEEAEEEIAQKVYF